MVEHLVPGERRYATLDDLDVLDAARRDPEMLVGGPGAVTLDEVQREPELLHAVKRAIDRNRSPGRFLTHGLRQPSADATQDACLEKDMSSISTVQTPAAVIDLARMNRNIDRMQRRTNALGVRFRPHVKTAKCTRIAMAERAAGAQGITVSTLKEAEHFFDDGITDILYAVGMVPSKLGRASALIRRGCDLKIITDNTEAKSSRF